MAAEKSDRSEQEALDQLTRLAEAMRSPEIERAQASGNLQQLCTEWRKVRSTLHAFLPIIEQIPLYGKPIAQAVRLLAAIADVACSR